MNTLKNILLKLRFILLSVILLTVYGCGGGGGSSTPAAGSSNLTGTAATGAPIANATVHIKGANGVMVETTTDANGKYTSPNLAALTTPYLVHVIKPAVGLNPAVELYSIGSAAGVVNVHPLTDLIIRTWYEVQGTNVEAEFNAATPATPPTATELGVIKQVVKNLVAQFLGLVGNIDSTSFDLISTPFTANSTGFDNFLDNIQINAASGVIGINTSGVSGAGTLAEYHATLAVSGTSVTSTLSEDLNNDDTFSVVSETNHDITAGITTSPYAGVWSLGFTVTAVGGLCGNAVNDTGALPFVVDSSGNFILLETDGSGRVMISGNIAANGSLTATVYGDTNNPNGGTCPAGTLTATMTSTSAGTGTLSQGGDEGTLTFARITNFAGTWTLRYTITAATDQAACGQAIASIGIPQGGTDTIVDAQGGFENLTENVTGTITSGGIVSFTIPGSNVTTDCDYGGTVGTGTGNFANAYGTFKHNNNKVSGTWSLTRQ